LLKVSLLALAAGLVFVAAAVFVYESTTFKPRLLEATYREARLVAREVAAPLRFGSGFEKDARDILRQLGDVKGVRMVILLDNTGREFARHQPKDSFQRPLDDLHLDTGLGYRFHDGVLDLAVPVEDRDEWLGTLLLRTDLPSIGERLPQYALMLVVVLLALLVMALLFYRGLHRYVIRPVSDISEEIALAASRFGGSTARRDSEDEIQHLIRTVRQTLSQIHRYQQELERTNRELKDRSTALEKELEERRRAEKQLNFMARHDVLTGLPNRVAFDVRLEELLSDARTENHAHAMFYMDLDQFKVVNDTCGHAAGDHLLRQVAELLRKEVRQGDIIARLGGDEFGVLLPYCNLEVAERIANNMLQALEDFRFSWDGKIFTIGVSIGLVPILPDSESRDSVLSLADAMCYNAKDRGRNCVSVWTGKEENGADRHSEMQWVSRITEAMEDHRIVLMQQAIAPLQADEDGHHYEILIRLQDQDGNLIAPGAFLPAAERYNLMPRIDRYVVSTMFSWLAANPAHLQQLHLCSINLSGVSLGDNNFQHYLEEQFLKFGIPPEKICFEVTETMAVRALNQTIEFMESFRAMGCKFSLDDFGSGFSSYAYLKNLPVDFLKIDGAFVRDIVEDPLDRAMVKSINEIGHVMGKKTIAEFVETQAIVDRLQAMGVDYAQGYHIGRPQPLDNLLFSERQPLA
jgi:diguanylate cyclase (GGDEF)-like protein